ncbi:MAG TPA: (5-formylfuran-3-yl)methyl phosphate synthase, partial [SAR202 cluster bacterium]|nr:(5-formylfuran-3-yl)methyl phosphate synthase [SAR202 cluster bacterium]
MILMVSVQDLYEAKQALKGGADIVDVKNLQEALVGSAHPNVVKEIRDEVPSAHHASVTLGVVPNQIGTVSMAVYAAGILDATSVKVGFMVSEYDVALETLLAAKEALIGTQTKLIGSLFADNLLYDGGIDPDLMVQLAKEGQCDGFLIDTLVKDGRNLFDFVPEDRLKEMVLEGKELGMSTALSGHLKMSDLDELSRVNPDIVGVRGAVCQKGDRDSRVHWESVSEFKKQLDLRQTGEIDVYPENRTSSVNQESNGWIIIDGTGKTCAGIIATLSEQINADTASFVEVIIPDVLNTYDLIVWAEKNSHDIVTQRKDA